MFDWKNFFEYAVYVNGKADDFPDKEACYRTVVSRAYYAAYHISKIFAEQKNGGLRFHSNEHQQVQNFFKGQKHDRRLTKIGSQLTRLHQDRKKADYIDDLNESPSMKAGKTIKWANEIISAIDSLSI